ncbi:MAG: ABC transporter permease [Verrucomicrobiota bacterium]
MAESTTTPPGADAQLTPAGDWWELRLSGRWRITAERPRWGRLIDDLPDPAGVRVVLADDIRWDSALLLFVCDVRQWCAARGVPCDQSALPIAVLDLLEQLARVQDKPRPGHRSENFLTTVGLATGDVLRKAREIYTFVGECVLSAVHLVKNPHRFRWGDCFEEMQKCGAMALPIVGLISLLVGLIMAYQSAVLMRQFGADIYVADAVGLVMVREMGAMMTAIILAGRTGAAFAATLGNMKANEEIDALATLGIRPVDYLVIPRLLALALMMPLLALYANGLGIMGGMVVSLGLLDIPPTAYWVETQTAIDLSDVATGLIKASTFGVLVGLAGCHRGLRAERSAAGVGKAATSAVVMGLLLIIVFDAVFSVVFNVLGL